mgnify:CR=1 FL=1
MDTFGQYDFRVRTYECGKNGRLTLPSLCNYLQEAAAINAEELTFSKSDFEAAGENISWVLTRLRVKITEFPKWERNSFSRFCSTRSRRPLPTCFRYRAFPTAQTSGSAPRRRSSKTASRRSRPVSARETTS